MAGQIEEEKAFCEERGLSPREEATEFLLDILSDGPRMQREIVEIADQDGIALKTLKRAKKDEGIVSTKLANGWQWSLKNWVTGADADGDQEGQGGQEGHNSIYRKTGPLGPLADGDPTESRQNQTICQEGQGGHIPDGNTPMDDEV
ncbi:MAG: hypothetical protein ACYCY2_00955 [Acidithiobacillus ferriphilus]